MHHFITMMTDYAPSLTERIRVHADDLTPGQRRVARYCIEHPYEASRVSSARMAKTVGVSESTVVRFAAALDVDGFRGLREAIQSILGARADQSGAEPTEGSGRNQDDPLSSIIRESLELDREDFADTVANLGIPDVVRAVRRLADATEIVIVGYRASFSLAYLAHSLIRQLRGHVRLVGDTSATSPEDVMDLETSDALFAITFPPYVSRTVDAVHRAVSRGIPTVALTDSLLSPVGNSEITLTVRHDSVTFFNSYVGAVAVINALAAGLAASSGRTSARSRHQLFEEFHDWVSSADRSPPD